MKQYEIDLLVEATKKEMRQRMETQINKAGVSSRRMNGSVKTPNKTDFNLFSDIAEKIYSVGLFQKSLILKHQI